MSANTPGFHVTVIPWTKGETVLSQLRRRVFIEEQKVPEALEWDGLDDACTHILARSADTANQALGCTRLTPQGQIGRMAVIPEARRQGIASAMLQCALNEAKQQGFDTVFLHAQTHASCFYARHGFIPENEVFMDAGIPHQKMRININITG